jgi:DNA-binding MarR family transcriptional regulator
MSKTILADTEGFTPIIDGLAQETSFFTAAVFGVIWRYCQMEDGVCHASLETIAKKLGIGRSTVCKHLKILVEKNYLKKGKTQKGMPITYIDTGKAGMRITVECSPRERECSPEERECSPRALKKVLKKEEDTLSVQKEPNEQQAMVSALLKVTNSNEMSAIQFVKLAAKLRKVGATPEKVLEMYGYGGWWYSCESNWKGHDKNQFPNQGDISRTWDHWDTPPPVVKTKGDWGYND